MSHRSIRRFRPSPSAGTKRALLALIAVESLLVGGYLLLTDAAVLSVRYLVYPFVWINLAVVTVRAVDVPLPTDRRSGGAAVVAVGYLLVLAWTSGLLAVGSGGPLSVRLAPAMPGWGPVLLVDGPVSLALVPFETIGYAGLATLVYVGVARAAAGVLSGLVGLVTCVSCVGPVVAAVVSGVLGGASTAAAGASTTVLGVTTGAYAYDLSTGLFVLTVAALWATLR
ncbi:DUF7546 family protein [Halobellus litoreus]|uniref:ABC transporter ATP-binding protein n=1 Tax=Halobellus litoreus TaxID=755310 RepID=A0ABD6DXC0_9EURY|nr:hypothetical protein [Halobellus litoreus]